MSTVDRPPAIETPPARGVRRRIAESAWDDDSAVARRAARGRRVARDLVELARLQRGEERAQSSSVDLAELLQAICAAYPEVRLCGPQPLVFCTDPRRLARVLTTLIDNACLHGEPPVSVRYDEGEIVVHDGGPGLAEDLLARATEPFVTGRRSRGRGVGLGLAIAARQAALLGAELRLSNAPEGGAVAQLWFEPASVPPTLQI